MKCQTSFFNVTVFKKNLTRFAPTWLLCAVIQMLVLNALKGDQPRVLAQNLAALPEVIIPLVVGYGLLNALCLFGDLFKRNMCFALHAMPLRRSCWLMTNYFSGLVFALIPAVIGFITSTVMLGEYWLMGLMVQASWLLAYILFFSMAVFCAVCAGSRLGMCGIYGVINFTPLLLWEMVTLFYEPMLYGVKLNEEAFFRIAPVLQLMANEQLQFDVLRLGSNAMILQLEGWRYLGICAGVGLVFLGLSLLIYRRRPLERAGDFIAVKPMAPVFLVVFTLGAATFLYMFVSLFTAEESWVALGIGLVLGYFGGNMLLKRTVKVFKLKTIGGFLVVAVLFAASFVLAWIDPMGIVTYVPRLEDIQCVSLHDNESAKMANKEITGFWAQTEDDVQKVRAVHYELAKGAREEGSGEQRPVYLTYKLKNGMTVRRQYRVILHSPIGQQTGALLSDLRRVTETESRQELENSIGNITYMDFGGYETQTSLAEPEEVTAFLDALEKDCADGIMGWGGRHHYNDGTEKIMEVCMTLVYTWEGNHIGSFDRYLFFPEDSHTFEYLSSIAP